MISVRSYRDDQVEEHDDPEATAGLLADGVLVWVDVAEPTDAELECLERQLSLHPLAIEDAVKHRQRPKLEHYPSHAFLVAYSGDLQEVDFFIGPQWVVTVREHDEQGQAWSADAARHRFERSEPATRTVGFLLHTLLDELVDGYFTALEPMEDALEDIEDRIFDEELGGPDTLQQDLFTMRRRLLAFRRTVVPLREAMAALLRGEVQWVEPGALVHLQDVYDHVLRAVDFLDNQRELLASGVDAHLATIANRQNQVMKQVTSWGAILLVSTLIAGIYGMNFEHMPELGWRFGYPMALGAMLALTIVLYLWFRARDWL
jgi:magnesium transporter